MDILVLMIIIAIIIFFIYQYINVEIKNQKELKEKQDLENKRLKVQRTEIPNIKLQIEEDKRQKQLKDKQELEKKIIRNKQSNLEKIRQIEKEKEQVNEISSQKLESKKLEQLEHNFTIHCNQYLKKETTAFYHTDYHSGGNWRIDGTIENMIWTLKNDASPFPSRLPGARKKLEEILSKDLPLILSYTNLTNLTVCVVPRAKKDSYYRDDQLYFRHSINDVVNRLNGFYNGLNYIKRHTNTKTTHLKSENGGDGKLPYVGITKETCTISNEIKNKDILLIDDIYTRSVNIDEDAIQAILDNGAKSVVFYAIGKTVSRF